MSAALASGTLNLAERSRQGTSIARRSLQAVEAVMRLEGMGRQGLLAASSCCPVH